MVLVIRKRLDHPRIKNILIPSTFWVYPALPTGELIMRDQCLIPTPATNSTSRSWSPLDAVGWVHCWIWTRFPRQVARFRGATVRGRACWQEENYPCLEADFSTTPTTSINKELFTMKLKENRWATMWTSDHNLLIWNIAKLLLLPHLLPVMVEADFHKFVQLIWNYLCSALLSRKRCGGNNLQLSHSELTLHIPEMMRSKPTLQSLLDTAPWHSQHSWYYRLSTRHPHQQTVLSMISATKTSRDPEMLVSWDSLPSLWVRSKARRL